MFAWLKRLFQPRPLTVICEWGGKSYPITMRCKTAEEVRVIFNEYAPKAPVCIGCGELIFPHTPVSYQTPGTVMTTDGQTVKTVEITTTGLAHLSRQCTPDPNFCGWVTEDGKVNSPYGEDFSIMERARRTGEVQIVSDTRQPH